MRNWVPYIRVIGQVRWLSDTILTYPPLRRGLREGSFPALESTHPPVMCKYLSAMICLWWGCCWINHHGSLFNQTRAQRSLEKVRQPSPASAQWSGLCCRSPNLPPYKAAAIDIQYTHAGPRATLQTHYFFALEWSLHPVVKNHFIFKIETENEKNPLKIQCKMINNNTIIML